jgi:hypothetical protein
MLLMRGSRASARHVQGSAAIGYAPSVHDVCSQISQANLLRNAAGMEWVNGGVVKTYVGFHRLVDWAPPYVVFG